jgi:hypothetical protein
VNLNLGLDSQLVIKAKQMGKLSNYDLIALPISHTQKLLSIGIKAQSGIELIDDLIVPVILKAHHLGHHKLITCGFDLIKDGVTPSSHPIPSHPLCLHHWFLRIEVNGAIPIRMKVRPKPRVRALFAALIHRITTVLIDYFLLGLLGVLVRHAVGALNGRVDLEHLTTIFIFLARVRRVVMQVRRWRWMSHSRFA